MSDHRPERGLRELSGRVRRLIDREVEDGIALYDRAALEARLAERFEGGMKGAAPPARARSSWLPAVGFAGAAVAALFILLWFAGPRPGTLGSAEGTFRRALAEAPGIRSLELTAEVREAAGSAPAGAAAFLSEALSVATRSASGSPAHVWSAAERLTPRYGLKEKMELLFGERAIERALMNYKDKFGEV